MTYQDIPKNNTRNGTFIKFIIGIVTVLSTSGIIGTVAMYRELGVMRASMRTELQVNEALKIINERVARNEERLVEIDKARNERTSWGHRLEQLESRMDKMEGRR